MKKYIVIMALAAVVSAGCQREEIVPLEDFGFTAVMEDFDGDTRTSLDMNNSVVWSEGDEIAIFQGKTSASRYRVSSSSVGSTVASFEKVTLSSTGSSLPANVALYPYSSNLVCESISDIEYVIEEVVFPEEQTYKAGSFAEESFVMVAVTSGLGDKKLKFRNAGGALRLRIRGDITVKTITLEGNSDEIIAGKASVTAYYGSEAPYTEMLPGGSRTVTLDCGSGVKLNSSTATEFVFALPPVSFEGGFTVTLTDSKGKETEYTTVRNNTVNRSKILNMPEFSVGSTDEGLQPGDCTDISDNGTANSYIVSRAGSYCFPAVKGNSEISVGSVASAEVLWETFGTSKAPEVGDLIAETAVQDGQILFRTADTFREGNAVIAAKNSAGTILWSWHIWMTDKPSEHVYANGAGTMMDRNLGATSATAGDVGAIGLLYQWGRKDPFLGSAEILFDGIALDKDSQAKSNAQWPEVIESDSMTGTIEYTLKNPMQVVYSVDATKDWYYAGSSDLLSNRWDEEKTIYDPCPPGWSVPYGGYDGFWVRAGVPETLTLEESKGGYFFPASVSGTKAWYPCVGYLLETVSNTLNVGDQKSYLACGYYWTSTTYASDYRHFQMSFEGNGVIRRLAADNGQYGQAVRCYKEGTATVQTDKKDYIDEYGFNLGKGIEIDGVIWAPVNCGYSDDFPYGKLYQWGRKYGQGYDGLLYDVNGSNTGTYSDGEVPVIKKSSVSLSTGQSKSNEDYYYQNTSYPYDWLSSPDDYLWNGGSESDPEVTEYDPCPEGWRVPTYAELDALRKNKSSWTTNGLGQPGYSFSGSRTYSDEAPQVFLPAAGQRSYNYNAEADHRGLYGYYWSSRPYQQGRYAYYLYFHKSNAYMNQYGRASGYSVRCVQE